MILTNKYGLPEAFVRACSVERHNKTGNYSATTLNKGVKEIVLSERHWEEMIADVSENVWAIFGTACHELFERVPDNCFHEESVTAEIDGMTVTGRVDSYDMENATVFDWKTASVWKIQFKDFSDWKQQGLTYAWLLNQNGLKVNKCVFVALLKDHSKSKAKVDATYPQSPVFKYEFDVTEADLQYTDTRIRTKIAEIKNAIALSDDEIAPCTKEERWADNDKFAVMKNGRKTALRVFDSEEDAEQYKAQAGGDYIEHRPAVSRKCEDYCPCKDFCNFYKKGE